MKNMMENWCQKMTAKRKRRRVETERLKFESDSFKENKSITAVDNDFWC